MCGIAGLAQLSGQSVDHSQISKMTDSIAHRGPDGQGQWCEKNIGLGHRRLAILDLSEAGNQPMHTPDRRFVMVYNGEVYNFKTLRHELVLLGHKFSSRTDSEVILAAFNQWGTEAIPRFNGMFAIAIWDRQEQKLFLARDRYGIKPLYISQKGDSLVFASEQRGILSLLKSDNKLDFGGLLEYLSFQNIITDRTFNKDIQVFPAAHFASLDIGKGEKRLKFTKYWDFDFRETEIIASDREYCEELDRLFKQAVERQMISDVEIGSYLSGGMDSGSITAILSRSTQNLKTFTCGFDLASATGIELDFDEREAAQSLSSLFRTQHFEILLNSLHMEQSLENIVWHLEELRVGQSYPNYYAAKLASDHVKVVLSGAGGDELFAGYPWRYPDVSGISNLETFTNEYFNFWHRILSVEEIKSLTYPIRRQVKDFDTYQIFRDMLLPTEQMPLTPHEYFNLSLRFEAKTFLHGLLIVEDKLSMAHGLETRLPFLDNDLVDFALRCPIRLKTDYPQNHSGANHKITAKNARNYIESNSYGKLILRAVMASYLPQSSLDRKKQGFSGPDASWFKRDSLDFVRKVLSSKESPLFDYLDYATTQTLLNQHLNGRQNRRLLVWSLLSLNTLLSAY